MEVFWTVELSFIQGRKLIVLINFPSLSCVIDNNRIPHDRAQVAFVSLEGRRL